MDVEILTQDYHTAGEPFRIVTGGVPDIPGVDVADRRQNAIGSVELQRIRALLCHEPRGHADMYGCFPVPPNDAGAALGVLFWHKDGFSTACGHGTIALATWAVRTGLVPADPDGETDVVIDVPSGRVIAKVRCAAGRVLDTVFRNVPSFVLHRQVSVTTSRGQVLVDVSFGGAFYASLPASAIGLRVEPAAIAELTAIGREIKWAVQQAGLAEHPDDARLSGCYGTMLFDELGPSDEPGVADDLGGRGPVLAGGALAPRSAAAAHAPGLVMPAAIAPGPYQRSITVFADGEVDRSPCGSGTSARMALLHADGRLGPGQVFTHESIIGTRFTATVAEPAPDPAGGAPVITEIRGSAYRTGEHRFLLDTDDPLGTGFVLR